MAQHVRLSLEPELGLNPALSTIRANPAGVKGAPRSEVNTKREGAVAPAGAYEGRVARLRASGGLYLGSLASPAARGALLSRTGPDPSADRPIRMIQAISPVKSHLDSPRYDLANCRTEPGIVRPPFLYSNRQTTSYFIRICALPNPGLFKVSRVFLLKQDE
jgi:hypothetical protein